MWNLTGVGVYAIVCMPTCYRYIGSSNLIRRRWHFHKHHLRRDMHGNNPLQAAWNEHGEDAFEFRILKHCKEGSLLKVEGVFLRRFENLLFNHSTEVRNKGIKMSLEVCAKMSIEAQRVARSPEGRKVRSDKAIRQWAKGNIGRKAEPTRICISCGREFVRLKTKVGKTSRMKSCLECAIEKKAKYGGTFNIANLLLK